jgi:hypothetical protein
MDRMDRSGIAHDCGRVARLLLGRSPPVLDEEVELAPGDVIVIEPRMKFVVSVLSNKSPSSERYCC